MGRDPKWFNIMCVAPYRLQDWRALKPSRSWLMGVFDDREKAQENKYFHDEELKFRAISRRNKLFGQWAAKELAVKASEVEKYVLEVVRADFQEAGDQDLLRKVIGDFKAKGKATSETDLKAKLEACMREAIKQLESEVKK
jgi:hypothetical protein